MQTFLQFFEDTRRDFLKKLGMGISGIGSGINPLKGFSKDDNDEDDDNEPWEGHNGDDYERFDFGEWFGDNVLDIIIDNSIGDHKISNPLADKIESMVVGKVYSGDQLSIDLMNIFDKHMEMSNDKFYETLEDPEFVEDLVSDLSYEVIKQLGLKQIFASAAARELRGDRQENILNDVKAQIDNPIEYSKFDTAGGKRDYEYTADSYKSFDSLCESLFEAYDTALSRTVHDNITKSLSLIGDETPKQALIRTIKKYKPERVAAYFKMPVDEFKEKFYNIKRGRKPSLSDEDKQAVIDLWDEGERDIEQLMAASGIKSAQTIRNIIKTKYPHKNFHTGRPVGTKDKIQRLKKAGGATQRTGSKITPNDLEIIIGLNLPQDKDVRITKPNHSLSGKVIRSIPHSRKDYSRGLNVREIKQYMVNFPHKFTDSSVSEREISKTLELVGLAPGKGYGNF